MSSQVDLVCEFGVLHALATAGKRGRLPRSTVGRLMRDGVARTEVHTRVVLARDVDDMTRLLAGAWDILATVLPKHVRDVCVRECDSYTRHLITARAPFDRAEFHRRLDAARATLTW